MHPCHFLIVVQELSHFLGILAMLCHTQVECLQAEVQQERVLWSGDASQVAHQLGDEFRGEAHLAESLHIGQTVIRLIWRAEPGELLCVSHPVEIAAVYHAAAYLSSHTVHILRGRVGDNVGTPLKRAAVHRCCEGVVHDEGHTVLMGDLGKALNVEDGATRIRNGLSEQGFGVRTEGCLNLLVRCFLRDKCAVDTEFLECYTKEVVGATIDFIRGDEMVASLADVEDGVEVGCLS